MIVSKACIQTEVESKRLVEAFASNFAAWPEQKHPPVYLSKFSMNTIHDVDNTIVEHFGTFFLI